MPACMTDFGCKECGVAITRGRGARIFCGRVCYLKALREKRRAARRHWKTHAVCAATDCNEEWTRASYRSEKIYCSKTCSSRESGRRPDVKARALVKQTRDRNAVTGRACKFCKRTDSTHQFQSPTICTRCARARVRTRCPRCDGPSYKNTTPENGGVLGCVVMSQLPPGFDCKTEV